MWPKPIGCPKPPRAPVSHERRFTAFSLKKEILVSVVFGDYFQPWGLKSECDRASRPRSANKRTPVTQTVGKDPEFYPGSADRLRRKIASWTPSTDQRRLIAVCKPHPITQRGCHAVIFQGRKASRRFAICPMQELLSSVCPLFPLPLFPRRLWGCAEGSCGDRFFPFTEPSCAGSNPPCDRSQFLPPASRRRQ